MTDRATHPTAPTEPIGSVGRAIMRRLRKRAPEDVAGTCSAGERRWLLLYALADLKRRADRERQIEAERRAERAWRESPAGRRYRESVEREDRQRREREESIEAQRRACREKEDAYRRGRTNYECAWDDPLCVYGRGGSCPLRVDLGRRLEREAFYRWARRQGHSVEDFNAWVDRAIAVGIEHGWTEDLIRSDWHPGGPDDYFALLAHKRAQLRIQAAVEETARKTRLQVTAELLGTEFALGDGRKVTWGAATREDHGRRIALLQKNAAGNVAAAARHRRAVAMLDEAGVNTLAELPRAGRSADDAAAA